MLKKLSVYLAFSLLLATAASAQVQYDAGAFGGQPVPEQAQAYTCKVLTPSAETAIDVLLQGELGAQIPYYKGQGWENETERIAVGEGYVMYTRGYGREIPGILLIPNGFLQLKSHPLPTGELAFMPAEDAASEVEKILQDIGIPCKATHIFALDKETLQSGYDRSLNNAMQHADSENSVEDLMGIRTTSEWTEEHESYFMFLQPTYHDIPVSMSGYYSTIQRAQMNGTYIYAIYSKDGLINLYAYNLFEILSAAEPQPLIDLSGAKAIVDSFYTIFDMDVKYIRLEYLRDPIANYSPDEQFNLVPHWVFTTRTDFVDENGTVLFEDVSDSIIIDAFSGKEK